ncbi:methylated-DNA--[protein]-cysteine S-methyltransferase [Aquisalibacillus elongatus]|uniref:methylated-DNA--[protein]-cysteine S-methyltransferase n=1 Tax=Aquisalibacillus elongatus TaxID=485577 RepID=A0A3N5AYH8_9BACI|nr:methylated-DNA--[protein]-cysteine S-methyltransferase [Aquisalibacillus elongatus]RPF50104.1 methylated-DNA-[protein]-cysteine S-methyltransferase [Aquisalibacillus elongatus]
MKKLIISHLDTPVGNMIFGGQHDSVYFIKIGTLAERQTWIEKWQIKHGFGSFTEEKNAFIQAKEEMMAYFNDDLDTFSFNMSLLGTDFQRQVWDAMLRIPHGDTWTYKDIAVEIEKPKAIRAVGGAINKNPITIAVPCHRVVGSDGSLTGYASGLDKKKYLLHHETKSNNWLHLTS